MKYLLLLWRMSVEGKNWRDGVTVGCGKWIPGRARNDSPVARNDGLVAREDVLVTGNVVWLAWNGTSM